jgi:DNA replication protein DnaC
MLNTLANAIDSLPELQGHAVPEPATVSVPPSAPAVVAVQGAVSLERCREHYRARLNAYGFRADPDQHAFETVARWCARRWRKETTLGLVLHGGNGNGKTTAARAIQQLFAIKFIAARDLPDWYANPDVPWLERAMPVPYTGIYSNLDLIIDDVGAERTTHHFGNVLNVAAELIDRRYDAWRANASTLTIITTNLSPVDFEKRYGKRTASRCAEMCALVAFKAPDHRRQH